MPSEGVDVVKRRHQKDVQTPTHQCDTCHMFFNSYGAVVSHLRHHLSMCQPNRRNGGTGYHALEAAGASARDPQTGMGGRTLSARGPSRGGTRPIIPAARRMSHHSQEEMGDGQCQFEGHDVDMPDDCDEPQQETGGGHIHDDSPDIGILDVVDNWPFGRRWNDLNAFQIWTKKELIWCTPTPPFVTRCTLLLLLVPSQPLLTTCTLTLSPHTYSTLFHYMYSHYMHISTS